MSSVPIAELTGPMLIGLCLNWCLFGCATVQVYYYHSFFPNDDKRLKTLVYALYVWDIIQTLFFTQAWFEIFGPGFGSLTALENIGTVWLSVPFMTGIASMVVQCFYTWRVYHLSKSLVLSAFIVILALMEGFAAIVLGFIMHFELSTFAELQDKTLAVTTVWLMGSACCDIIICTSMLYYLYTAKRRTFVKSTENNLTRLIRLSVGAGIATAIIATIDSILYLTFPHNNYHMAPVGVLGKLYTNSMLVLINSRYRTKPDDGVIATYLWEGNSEHPMNNIRTRPVTVAVEVSVDRDVQMVSFERGNRSDHDDSGKFETTD